LERARAALREARRRFEFFILQAAGKRGQTGIGDSSGENCYTWAESCVEPVVSSWMVLERVYKPPTIPRQMDETLPSSTERNDKILGSAARTVNNRQ